MYFILARVRAEILLNQPQVILGLRTKDGFLFLNPISLSMVLSSISNLDGGIQYLESLFLSLITRLFESKR
jgi:hypothetical protein